MDQNQIPLLQDATQAVHWWSSEASRADDIARDLDRLMPTTGGEQPFTEATLDDLTEAIEQYKLACMTLNGIYTTAMYREQRQQQLNSAPPQSPANGYAAFR